MDKPDAMFVPQGDAYLPTPATYGPWGRGLLHGGAVGALCVHVLEAQADADYRSTRFSIDIVRPVPSEPITVTTREVRKGQRLEVLDAELTVNDKLVARSSLLRMRPVAVPLPRGAVRDPEPPPDKPEDFYAIEPHVGGPNDVYFVGTAVEMRVPDPGVFGSGRAWFKMLLPVLPDTELSRMERTVGAADFSNGLSQMGDGPFLPGLAFPNADLSVRTHRPPEGEWIRLEATSIWRADGIGMATGWVHDMSGGFGVTAQSLALDEMRPAT